MDIAGKEFVLVEDDPSFREFVEAFLKKKGCKVRCYDKTDIAIKELRDKAWNWSPFMIITDLVFSGSSGYVFLRQLSEVYARKPVAILVISQLIGSDDQSEAELAGATRYLRKPVKNESILEASIVEAATRLYNPNKNGIVIKTSY